MKQKLYRVLSVYPIFQELSTKHYNNFSVAYKIAKAVKELDSNREFYFSKERQLVESYASKDKNGSVKILEGNRVTFDKPEYQAEFEKQITELQQTEIDVFDPFEIKLSDFKAGELNLTPQQIIFLEDFVIFIDNEKEVLN